MVRVLSEEDEWNTLKSGSTAVIVDFTASWCGPCKMISPFFEELSGKYSNVIFVKIDVDELDSVAASCGVSAMPTFQVWKGGEKVDEMVGASKEKLEALVVKYN
mmetsp:Transcript_40463/g.67795  ORF Transcript_40463/g.67795 Transcript_40463/m.67795 type:complete len:104 (+) Transcript_40463:143-454(+)|eukprot:CAMPEP_0198229652 /NCGR_PEP_ID=MMETSP1445-20131203/114234_1 /TAXON_ID=36898 /ORGANISM="Pyramimonas sp., Strain CCMP2087" /LENGTH=103 /DNA_ID=CAMNT_0043910119 /DNA_START=133 /DNA_END=444 /DNA_ORIENTATION=+